MSSITNAMGGVTSFTYDAAGNLLSTTDTMGGVTSNVYDVNGNLTSTTDAVAIPPPTPTINWAGHSPLPMPMAVSPMPSMMPMGIS